MAGGSSPLARGLRRPHARAARDRRIIPARAGFTRRTGSEARSQQDHPRSRGVYTKSLPDDNGWVGSSPLARGLHEVPPGRQRMGRIIPARAGFTITAALIEGVKQDHPRSRGVYLKALSLGPTLGGSSPLARGLRGPHPPVFEVRGIIPARAGFTRPGRAHRSSSGDHPRSRGVYQMRFPPPFVTTGSSPLARGLPGGVHGA